MTPGIVASLRDRDTPVCRQQRAPRAGSACDSAPSSFLFREAERDKAVRRPAGAIYRRLSSKPVVDGVISSIRIGPWVIEMHTQAAVSDLFAPDAGILQSLSQFPIEATVPHSLVEPVDPQQIVAPSRHVSAVERRLRRRDRIEQSTGRNTPVAES